jgi:hypothetical protein
MAPSGAGKPIKVQFEPGAAFGAALATGDLDFTAIGTLTLSQRQLCAGVRASLLWRRCRRNADDRSGDYRCVSSYLASFKLGNRAQTLGVVYHDGAFAVAGQIGRPARLMPMRMRITNAETGVSRTYRCELFRHRSSPHSSLRLQRWSLSGGSISPKATPP